MSAAMHRLAATEPGQLQLWGVTMRFRQGTFVLRAAALFFVALPGAAQTLPTAAMGGSEPKLETVVVTGVMPGPSLWRVNRGRNTLYILATVSPLPAKMQWMSAEVEEILSRTDEVIAPGGALARVGVGDAFKISLLARSAYAAIRIPERQTLADLLPAAVYRQWRALKVKYLPDARKVERSRPMFASQDLYHGAISASGMTRADVVWRRVAAIAEAGGIPVTETKLSYPLALDRRKYKAGIEALKDSRGVDSACFAQTVESLEVDLETMRQGANAWAIGDLETLRSLRHAELQPPCKAVYDQLMGFQRRPERDAEAGTAWLAAATTALARNDVTFAVLPIVELTRPDGVLERFRAAGFDVEDPLDAAHEAWVVPDHAP